MTQKLASNLQNQGLKRGYTAPETSSVAGAPSGQSKVRPLRRQA
jgi:hypothetical protein